MKIKELYEILNKVAPENLAEPWDNSGPQVEFPAKDVKKVLCAMEINDTVIDEAIAFKADIVITHHPLMIEPVKTFSYEKTPGRYVLRLAEKGISAFSMHTNFDSAEGGMNDMLLEKLGLEKEDGELLTEGFMRLGVLKEETSLKDFALLVKDRLNIKEGIRVAGPPGAKIKKILIISGGGSGFWEKAIEYKADALLSGDIKHHDAAAARAEGLYIIDAGHAGTEKIFGENFAKKLRVLAPGLDVKASEAEINPFTFVI